MGTARRGSTPHNAPVMIFRGILSVLCALGPAAGWLLLTRPGRARSAVAAVLVAWSAFVAWALLAQPAFVAETLLAYVPVVAAIVLIGRRLPDVRRTEQPGGRRRARLGYALFLGVALLLSSVPALRALADSPFVPSAEVLLPLPDGLAVLSDTGEAEDGHCGSALCTRTFTIGGDGDVTARMVTHLRERGWTLRSRYQCRPHGWLIDSRYLCVVLGDNGTGGTGGLRVSLYGARGTSFDGGAVPLV